MPQPGRQELSRVEVNKAKADGTKDNRRKSPLRVETQTKTAAEKVIKAGKKRAEMTVDPNLGLDLQPAKQMSAAAAAKADMKAAGWTRVTTREAVAKTMADTAASKPKRVTEAADMVQMRELQGRQVGHLEQAQKRFESAPAGADKEKLRRQIGRSMQSGIVPHTSSITQLACQTPNCDKSVKLAGDINDQPNGDVVCNDCYNKGDKAGAEYRDRPENVAGSVSGSRRSRG
jgi:hypothetical protein